MLFRKLFPCALAACFALVLPFTAAAQTGDSRVRLVAKKFETRVAPPANDDPVIISLASEEDIKKSLAAVEDTKASLPLASKPDPLNFRQLITSAIDQRLGTRYSWGGTGPSGFDCSGFVWSTFQSAGIDFERASARTLWSRFAAPVEGEQYKFGTLVFFSNLAHVGIVADEHGFYHASRHHGVIYSPFNDYWRKRIDGFRRVPVPTTITTD